METSWNCIPVSEINKPTTETVAGIQLEVVAAYHDVPVAARFSVDESENKFIIHLKYLSDPEPTKTESDGDVTIEFGRYSKRIYQIRINISVLEKNKNSKITFNLVKNADNFLKNKLVNFKDINKRNSTVVEKWLDWGIENKRLDLAIVS